MLEEDTIREIREGIMSFRVIALGLTALPLGAHAYDIEAYCQQVGAGVEGSAQVEAACREQERTAQAHIQHMSAPARIMKYCEEVGQSAGGSYQIMEACIKEEAKAKDELK
jgi:hypothetical protein